MDDDKLLKITALLHENLVSQLQLYYTEWDNEQILFNIAGTAKFLWHCHSGALVDPRLEDLLRRLSAKIFKDEASQNIRKVSTPEKSKKICHIASEVYSVGGHTRTITNWIEADTTNTHDVIVTNQSASRPTIQQPFTYLDVALSLVERAKLLRTLIKESTYDFVILHVHPDEVIAFVALSGLDIPIILFNHADHVFWLGVSFTTVIADFVESHQAITELKRGGSTTHLPLLLSDTLAQKVKKIEKSTARANLTITEQTVLVSMATPHKYTPFDSLDFIGYFSNFLLDRKDLGLYIIGLSKEEVQHSFDKTIDIKNMHFLGLLEDPYEYLVAADIFIEPLSIGTGLGTLEAILCGCTPLFNYGKTATIDGDGAISLFNSTETRATTIEEYTEKLNQLIDDVPFRNKRLSEYQSLLDKFKKPKWNEYLDTLYQKALGKEPIIKYEEDQKKLKELAHARFNNFQNTSITNLLEKFMSYITADFFLSGFITVYNQHDNLKVQYKYLEDYSRGQREEIKLLKTDLEDITSESDKLKNKITTQDKIINEVTLKTTSLQNQITSLQSELAATKKTELDAIRIINEHKASISFKLGAALTFPVRIIYDYFTGSKGLNIKSFLITIASILIVGVKSPLRFLGFLSFKNVKILFSALRNEPIDVIYHNFKNLMRTGKSAGQGVPNVFEIKSVRSLSSRRQQVLSNEQEPLATSYSSNDELPLIDISIVTYNSSKWIDNFFDSLMGQSYPLKRINLIVVDHSSTDDSLLKWRTLAIQNEAAFGGLKINSRPNKGFGAGHNYNFGFSKGDFFLVSNVDLEFDKDALSIAVSSALNSPMEVASWEFRQKPYEHPKYYDAVTLETAWSSHACILIRAACFKAIGGYCKKIFMYGEDVYMSYELREAGYILKYLPSAVVWHYTYAEANEVKKLQFLHSTLANSYIRLRFGSRSDIMDIPKMQLSLLNNINHVPVSKKEIYSNYLKLAGNSLYFLSGRGSNKEVFPLNEWDYEIIRDGAFFKFEKSTSDFKSPLVSIITRTYKGRQKWLSESISSILNQTYEEIELLIVEDGGATMTEYVNGLRSKNNERNMRYIPCEKLGRSGVGNIGLAKATGEYIMFLDDDDLLFADHVEVLIQTIISKQQVGENYKGAYALSWEVLTEITPNSSQHYFEKSITLPPVFRTKFDREKMRIHNYIPIQAILFSRELYDRYGGFDESLDNLEDWNLWVRYSSESDFILVEKVTSLFRTPADPVKRQERQDSLNSWYEKAVERNNLHFESILPSALQ